MVRTLLISLLLVLSACSHPASVVFSGSTMGTTYTVKIVTERKIPLLQGQIDRLLVDINQVMSTYIPDSQISRLNRHPVGEPFRVDPSLIELVDLSMSVSKRSDGAFDVTVGPLVNLWGFGPTDDIPPLPEPEAITAARNTVGMHLLKSDGDSLERLADVYLDLSAIAKGYAVDRVSDLLLKEGFSNHMVEIGGEVRTRGLNDRGHPWVIAIEKPELQHRSIYTTIPLSDMGMATSGDYRNYREVAGKRYSHTIDPRTGYPITHKLASVTVLHPVAAQADALATAISVMGPESGQQFAETHKLLVLFIIRSGNEFEARKSSELEHYLERFSG